MKKTQKPFPGRFARHGGKGRRINSNGKAFFGSFFQKRTASFLLA
jgi:hypothetical protein